MFNFVRASFLVVAVCGAAVGCVVFPPSWVYSSCVAVVVASCVVVAAILGARRHRVAR